MGCVSKAREVDELREMVRRERLDEDVCIKNVMIGMYSRCGRVGFARMVFDGMVEKDLVLWSLMIEGYGRVDLYFKALEVFKEMRVSGIVIDYVASLDVKIAELAARSLFELDAKNLGHYILLSNVYTSLGKIEEANRIRSLMKRK
ncbi:uncharacterized protein A4U43_C07F8310 [Asparagus officinalis]|uniref:Pentatricopeptide repeat-containing protein n=1 Tax=Asparagus officinalis TaxID=4686 RepID=A0A5P1EAF9_ASPOF|nr:uncharacterized protein A4U43_C07F8310 [Asparagus officinalis]